MRSADSGLCIRVWLPDVVEGFRLGLSVQSPMGPSVQKVRSERGEGSG